MTQVIRTLVVDDERYARDELKHLLGEFACLEVIGEAESGEEAVIKSLQLKPDVVFLDVEMPQMNGMEAAKSLSELKKVPRIVFATAYPEFAVEAFRFEAMDYLLKPYDEEQLHRTVERMGKTLLAGSAPKQTISSGKLAVEVEGEIHYVEPMEILYICREEKVSKVMTKQDEFETRMPLKELESRLQPFSFFRIHKSYLVNLHYVSRLTPWFNGAYQLEVDGTEEKLAVSRNYVKGLRERMEL